MIEQLEHRRHLSATLTGNVLTIIGTTRSDDIAIAAGREAFVVHDNGTQTAFATRQVRTIRVFGLAGDDSIIVSPKLTIRNSIEAGTGHDRVGGGAGDDTIFGGRGDDTLVGNDGEDFFDAGPDDDFVLGGNGVSVVHGGGGHDRAEAGAKLIGSGVEERPFGFGSDLVREGDRFRLVVTGQSLLGDFNELSPPAPQMNGGVAVTHTYIQVVNGANPPDVFEVTQDVTDFVEVGFQFNYVHVVDPSQSFSVPFLLPTQ